MKQSNWCQQWSPWASGKAHLSERIWSLHSQSTEQIGKNVLSEKLSQQESAQRWKPGSLGSQSVLKHQIPSPRKGNREPSLVGTKCWVLQVSNSGLWWAEKKCCAVFKSAQYCNVLYPGRSPNHNVLGAIPRDFWCSNYKKYPKQTKIKRHQWN